MAWLFIPAEFIPAVHSNSSLAVADSLTASSWPSLPSGLFVTSSGRHTQRPASWPGWKRKNWIRLLSGTTLEPLMASHGVASWIASVGASPVRTSALLARVLASKASALACGASTRESSLRFDPALSSSRTSRRSVRGASTACSPTLPRSGSMRSGFVSERPTPGLPTNESGSSSWPTPNTGESSNGHGRRGGRPRNGRQSGADLSALVKDWPTPGACDWKAASCIGQRRRQLSEAILSFPHGPQDATTSKDGALSSPGARTLNPQFVEWLMGWPIGSTDCGSSETASCPSKRRSPTDSCTRGCSVPP